MDVDNLTAIVGSLILLIFAFIAIWMLKFIFITFATVGILNYFKQIFEFNHVALMSLIISFISNINYFYQNMKD